MDRRIAELNDSHTSDLIKDITASYGLYFRNGAWTCKIWEDYTRVECEQVVDIFNGKLPLGERTVLAAERYLVIVPEPPHSEACLCVECEAWGILSELCGGTRKSRK